MGGARRLGARLFCPGGRKVATLSSSSSIFGEPPSRGISSHTRGLTDGYGYFTRGGRYNKWTIWLVSGYSYRSSFAGSPGSFA